MAAYAALTSLNYIIHQLQNHPLPPISLDKQQVESLTENIDFLLEFLQGNNSFVGDSEEVDPLQSRIADAAYAAEDIIESNIVDKINQVSCINFHQDLQKVIEEMDSIKKVAMKIITTEKAAVQYEQQRDVSESEGSSRASSNTMVGFDEVLLETLDKLTAGRLDRQVIPIVGMGGIGKTTLARNIYAHPLIKEHFDVCAWATISQQFNSKEILCEVLSQAQKDQSKESLRGMGEDALGLALYKHLSRRRFLIVMDDMWSIEAWDKIKRLFPDDSNGSRILVTTRQSELGSQLDNDSGPQIRFLDEVSSWDLFSQTVFGERSCPPELKEIGEDIARNCKGLPLSIVVVGGLLKKLEHTPECWESIRKNLSSAVNLENDRHCLKVLKMSYNYLQAYLKPCFLYMGVFEEDSAVRVSTLINLWACEGFLKPVGGKSLKTIGEEYLRQLVDRNLILVDELGSIGNIKFCKIHDLLRDLCLREAEKERFYHVVTQDSPQEINNQRRRIVIPRSTSKERAVDALGSSSSQYARSIICDKNIEIRLSSNFKLLRLLQTFDRSVLLKYEHFVKDAFESVNARYLGVGAHSMLEFPSSVNLHWNLHMLIVDHPYPVTAPVEFWKMTQLRHVQFTLGGLYLAEPPSNDEDNAMIMENLHTLTGVRNLKLSEEVVKRIPNVEKLRLEYYNMKGIESHGDYYCVNNLERLHKLESFFCMDSISRDSSLPKIAFPSSLKKLALSSWNVDWEDVVEKMGWLPLLQKLTLGKGFFRRGKWETVEGQFPNLKFLSLQLCSGLEYWLTETSHFPRLETLHLYRLPKLKEMSSEIGEIATLRLIVMEFCNGSAVECAKQIVEEQEELQGEEEVGFHVRAVVGKQGEALQSLATRNFQVEVRNYN